MRFLIPFFLILVSGCNATVQLAKEIDTAIHDINSALNREEKTPSTLQIKVEELTNDVIKPRYSFKPPLKNPIQKKVEEEKTNSPQKLVPVDSNYFKPLIIEKKLPNPLKQEKSTLESTEICKRIVAKNIDAISTGLRNNIDCNKIKKSEHHRKSDPIVPKREEQQYSQAEICNGVRNNNFELIKIALKMRIKC